MGDLKNYGTKTFIEKLGDLLSSKGKRFLFGICSFILGSLLSFAANVFPPIVLIGLPFFVGGALMAVSLLEETKTYFDTGISIKTPSGEFIPCIIVKQKHFALMPLVPFISPFFYLPYKTQYHLIKNMAAPNIAKGSRINDILLDSGILNSEPITGKTAQLFISNAQLFADIITEQVDNSRKKFVDDIKPFVETELIEEIWFTNQLSICKALDDAYIIFHYARGTGAQRGFLIDEEQIDKIKEDSSSLMQFYIQTDLSNGVIEFNHVTLERLLNYSKKEKNETARRVVEEKNRSKETLTKKIIIKSLKAHSAGRTVFGIFLCLPALGALELSIFEIVSGMIVALLFTIPFGALMLYFAVKNIRTGKRNKSNLLKGNYRIVKTICTEVIDQSTDEDTSFVMTFANGERNTFMRPLGVEGDPFYIVYLEGAKKAKAYFSGIEYYPAPELTIEEN